MNVEHRLIGKIIREQNFGATQRCRVTPRMFASAEARQMFKAIQSYFNDPNHYGRTPSLAWMKDRFQSYEHAKSTETIPELCELLRIKAMERQIGGALEEVSEILQGEGPYQALARMRAEVLKAQTMVASSRDVILADSADALIDEYKRINKSQGLLGVPWPWEPLNIQTQGMLPEEFIVLYGRLKSMKTWIGIKIATHAYEVGNRRIMFYSCEMPPEQLRRRVAATLCGLDYDKLKRAKLPEDRVKEYFKRLRNLKEEERRNETATYSRSFLITSDKEDPAGGGVSHVMAKADQFQPHLIIVDSFYRMRDDRTGKRSMKWEVQAAITQDLKHAAQKLQVPIIGITQKNRNKGGDDDNEGMEDISYTDAAGQEADLGLRIVKDGEDGDGTTNIQAFIAGAREIKTDGFSLKVIPSCRWDWVDWIKMTKRSQSKSTVDDGASPRSGARRERHVRRTPPHISGKVRREIDTNAIVDLDDEDLDVDYE